MIANLLRASSVLIVCGALMSCLPEDSDRNNSHELAWSLFAKVCLSQMPDHDSIIQYAAAQGWQAIPDGKEVDPPQRLSRGPNRSWRVVEGGMTVLLGIEILGDPAMAERMLAGAAADGSGMIFCNVHFDGGDYETITEDIGALSIMNRNLGSHGVQMGARNPWVNRIWGIGRGGWQSINFTFDPNGSRRFLESSANFRRR